MTMKTILLDVDGVLANWMKSACRAIGEDYSAIMGRFDEVDFDSRGEHWGIEALGDIDPGELWDAIHAEGRSFWAELEPYPWAIELYEACRAEAPTYILTSPSRHHSSPAGKVEWMDRHLGGGEPFRDFLIGSPKELCARPGSLLIDDRPRNCDRFRRAGGSAILFPTPWNHHCEHASDPLAFVMPRIKHWLAG